MADVLTLLSMPHSNAVKLLVQDSLKPGVSVADLVIDSPAPGAGLEMISNVYIAAGAYSVPEWPYFGETTFTYHALDLADTFSGIPLAFQMPATFNTWDLAQRLSQAFNIHFDPTDIHNESITLTEQVSVVVLKAGSGSSRWRGSVNITIHALPGSGL